MALTRKYTEKQREQARARTAKWVKDNPDRHRANQARYPERNRARASVWYRANKKRALAAVTAWGKANPQKRRAARAKWAKANPENVSAIYARWQKAHPEEMRARGVAWARQHPEKVRAWNAKARLRRGQAEGSFTAADLRAQFARQGGRCYYCGSPLEKYHTEHKTPLSRGGSNWPENIVCACPTCNLRKNKLTDTEFMERLKRTA